MRYPLAQNVAQIPGRMALVYWLACLGAYRLLPAQPVYCHLLVAAAILEVVYCLLFKVTYLRTLVSGLVKSCGPIAAVFVVNPNPSPYLLILIFALGILLGNRRTKCFRRLERYRRRQACHAKRFPSTLVQKSGTDYRHRVGAYSNYWHVPANGFSSAFGLALSVGKRRCGIRAAPENRLITISTSGRMSGSKHCLITPVTTRWHNLQSFPSS